MLYYPLASRFVLGQYKTFLILCKWISLSLSLSLQDILFVLSNILKICIIQFWKIFLNYFIGDFITLFSPPKFALLFSISLCSCFFFLSLFLFLDWVYFLEYFLTTFFQLFHWIFVYHILNVKSSFFVL